MQIRLGLKLKLQSVDQPGDSTPHNNQQQQKQQQHAAASGMPAARFAVDH